MMQRGKSQAHCSLASLSEKSQAVLNLYATTLTVCMCEQVQAALWCQLVRSGSEPWASGDLQSQLWLLNWWSC